MHIAGGGVPSEATADALSQLGAQFNGLRSVGDVLGALRTVFAGVVSPVDEAKAALADLDDRLAAGAITEREYNEQLSALTEQLFGAEQATKAQTAASLMGKDGLSSLLSVVSASTEEIESLSAAAEGIMGHTILLPNVVAPEGAGAQTASFLAALTQQIQAGKGQVQGALQAIFSGEEIVPDYSDTAPFENLAAGGMEAGKVIVSLRNLLSSLARTGDEAADALSLQGIPLGGILSIRDALAAIRAEFGELSVPSEEATAAFRNLNDQLKTGAVTEEEYAVSLSALTEQLLGVEKA